MGKHLLPCIFLISSFCFSAVNAEVEGFYVCGAGRNASNAHYLRCDTGAEYSTACMSLKPKEVMYFSAIPPYNWQLYTYEGPLKPVTVHYKVNMTDFLDPPTRGWAASDLQGYRK